MEFRYHASKKAGAKAIKCPEEFIKVAAFTENALSCLFDNSHREAINFYLHAIHRLCVVNAISSMYPLSFFFFLFFLFFHLFVSSHASVTHLSSSSVFSFLFLSFFFFSFLLFFFYYYSPFSFPFVPFGDLGLLRKQQRIVSPRDLTTHVVTEALQPP